MKITITSVESLPEDVQRRIGQAFLLTLHYAGLRVDGVHIEFDYETADVRD